MLLLASEMLFHHVLSMPPCAFSGGALTDDWIYVLPVLAVPARLGYNKRVTRFAFRYYLPEYGIMFGYSNAGVTLSPGQLHLLRGRVVLIRNTLCTEPREDCATACACLWNSISF